MLKKVFSENISMRRTSADGYEASLEFSANDPVFLGHYPSNPIYPASLVIEICCSLICEFLNLTSFCESGYRLSRSVFTRAIRPGDMVRFEFLLDAAGLPPRVDVRLYLDQKIADIQFDKNPKQWDFPLNIPRLTKSDFSPAINYLPQRYPLLAVDLIQKDCNGEICSALKSVSYSDYYYRCSQSHDIAKADFNYPFGAVIEGIEQSAALLLARQWHVVGTEKVIVIGGLSGVTFEREVQAGDIIAFHSCIHYLSSDYAILSGIALVHDHRVMAIEKIFVVAKWDL